jgi:hypothetical protein
VPAPDLKKGTLIMQIRTAMLAIAAISSLSTAAFATPNPHDTNHPSSREQLSDSCSTLESQYNSVIEAKQSAAKLTRAEGLHAKGVDQCNINESSLGVQSLQQSLRDLGVKPAA